MSASRHSKLRWPRLPVFRTMSLEALDELADVLEERVYTDGQVILSQGDEGDEMFLLEEGTVEIHKHQNDGDDFRINLEAPAVFGEMALVTHAARTATVRAAGTIRCLRLERLDFNRMVAQDPMVAVFLTESVGQRLLEADSIQEVGKYVITGRLGSGGAATVFEGIQAELGKPVALKMLSHSLVLQTGFAERFKAEAKLVAGLRHDHVVEVIDTESAWGTHFIVMERLTGNLLEEFVEQQTVLEWATIRQVLVEVCEALQFAHDRGLLHRDIKPSNVFFTADRRAKILDFGIAVEVGRSGDDSGQRLGTPYYMSPEQILGWELDGRADLYATGVMAYELATGRLPFYGDTLRELLGRHLKEPFPDARAVRPDIPEDLLEFIRVTTAKHPDDRYPTCGEAAHELRVAAEHPLVEHMDLLSLAISYHPSRSKQVEAALDRLGTELGALSGVKLCRTTVVRVPDEDED